MLALSCDLAADSVDVEAAAAGQVRSKGSGERGGKGGRLSLGVTSWGVGALFCDDWHPTLTDAHAGLPPSLTQSREERKAHVAANPLPKDELADVFR